MTGFHIALIILLFIAATNGYVTYRVVKSDYYDSKQKYLQFVLIWIVPVIGAILCYVFSREPTSTHTGTYTEVGQNNNDWTGYSGYGDSGGSFHEGQGGDVGH